MAAPKLLNDSLPWATISLIAIALIYTIVGGALVLWGDKGTLSFDDYGTHLVGFAGAFGILGIGRGIAASKGR